VLDVRNVTQIDVLEQHNILLVMYDKTLYSYAIEALDPEESATAQSKRGRKIGHANFFKVGIFEGQHLVCSVKPPGLAGASDIKVYKPESMPSGKKKSGLAKMLAGGQEVLKPYKVSCNSQLWWRRMSNRTIGILYSHRSILCTFPQIHSLRWIRQGI